MNFVIKVLLVIIYKKNLKEKFRLKTLNNEGI